MTPTGGQREHTPTPEPQRAQVVRIHVVPHVRVSVRCVRLRVPCTAYHVLPPAFYMSELPIYPAQKAININAETLTCS